MLRLLARPGKVRAITNAALERIAANDVANRPGRIEPRVLKRRRHRYPLMRRSRREPRKELPKELA